MVDILFYLFSALILGSAILVVLGRNPVNAAMFLLLAMGGAAMMFLLLEAYFLAVLQVLVYAGAVVVLFLFIIMLIDPQTGGRKWPGRWTLIGSAVAFLLLIGGVSILVTGERALTSGTLGTTKAVGDVSQEYGYYLFSIYLLPFLVAGFLLLVAMLGVILISKRYQSPEAEKI
jgi:NADH-quinone oxidoreductase subunit J